MLRWSPAIKCIITQDVNNFYFSGIEELEARQFIEQHLL